MKGKGQPAIAIIIGVPKGGKPPMRPAGKVKATSVKRKGR